MRFLPHAHRISLLSPAPVSHIFHNCRPSMPRKQKTALVPTPIKQSHEAMVVSYRPQTLHDTIHTVLPGEVLPAIPSYLEFIAVRLFVFQLTYFNSQPYEEADLPPVPREHSLDISTHSLTKRLTSDIWHTEFFHRYFNSQPHEEADSNRPYENDDEHISTHSLTKRLTLLSDYFNAIANISTHSLTKRLTDPLGMFIRFVIFQLTASRRGWQLPGLLFRQDRWISTHSLTKRLTMIWFKTARYHSFQLTASRRGWRPLTLMLKGFWLFQLTASRRGWRLPQMLQWFFHHYFNSQPHEEADFSSASFHPLSYISTHSLTKRLTVKHLPVIIRL